MKKIISLILITAMVLTACICFSSCNEQKTYTIGICQIQPHVALDAATQGFKDALIKEFGEENITFIEQNA